MKQRKMYIPYRNNRIQSTFSNLKHEQVAQKPCDFSFIRKEKQTVHFVADLFIGTTIQTHNITHLGLALP